MSERYLECISGPELERLKAQHEAWSPETTSLLNDAGFSQCDRILEAGCGPGLVTMDIARSINPKAAITAVDVSDYYLNHLRNEVRDQALSKVEVVRADLMEEAIPGKEYDAAFCRWFLIWVTRGIDAVLTSIHRSLRPGGTFASMEYLTLRSACHSPPCSVLTGYVQSWEDFYRDCGGTTELGSSLPGLLTAHGFEIVEMRCVGGYAPKGHRLFKWWQRLFVDFHERFREKGFLDDEQIRLMKDNWQAMDADPNAFVFSPLLLQTIARKK